MYLDARYSPQVGAKLRFESVVQLSAEGQGRAICPFLLLFITKIKTMKTIALIACAVVVCAGLYASIFARHSAGVSMLIVGSLAFLIIAAPSTKKYTP